MLCETLRGQGIERIYSSPYPRAVDTVTPLAIGLGLNIEIRYDLRERRLAAVDVENWREELKKTWADFDYALPGGESNRECQQRVRACVLGILRETDTTRVAICSHGNAIALLLNSIDPSFRFAKWAAMGNPHLYHLNWEFGLLRLRG
jgi:2,3-bisphosphoglycerate-dependent phosphoglycerate mutase